VRAVTEASRAGDFTELRFVLFDQRAYEAFGEVMA
jgi:hypothetical protein